MAILNSNKIIIFSKYLENPIINGALQMIRVLFFGLALAQFIPVPKSNCEGDIFVFSEMLKPMVLFFMFKFIDCIIKKRITIFDFIEYLLYIVMIFNFLLNS